MVCLNSLPITWSPTSAYTNRFWLADSSQLSAPFTFDKAGDYVFKALIDDCLVQDTLFLRTSECLANLYLPNAFSPGNNDNINDIWEPLGDGFLPLDLQVFDRWGGLIHRSENGTWDGQTHRLAAPTGTYLFLLKYKNTKTGAVELVAKEVVLVR